MRIGCHINLCDPKDWGTVIIMQGSNHPDYISTAQAAKILGLDRSGVIRRIKSGELHPVQTLAGKTGAHLFDRADVEALVAK